MVVPEVVVVVDGGIALVEEAEVEDETVLLIDEGSNEEDGLSVCPGGAEVGRLGIIITRLPPGRAVVVVGGGAGDGAVVIAGKEVEGVDSQASKVDGEDDGWEVN